MEGKKTMGRRRIEIKKIEKRSSRQVTFTKRRGGLFRKASELALLCGAEVAIIMQSPAGKIYTFSHPSVEALLSRLSLSPPVAETEACSYQKNCYEEQRKCEEAVKMLEKEREKEKMKETETEKMGGFWWDKPIEGMELHELEEIYTALEGLKKNVDERLKEFEKLISNSQSAPASAPAPAPAPAPQAEEGFAASSSDLIHQYEDIFKDDDCHDLFDILKSSA